MSGKRILAGERRPGSAYGTRMEERVCLCGAVQALGEGTLARGVVVGSVGANPWFWHHCPRESENVEKRAPKHASSVVGEYPSRNSPANISEPDLSLTLHQFYDTVIPLPATVPEISPSDVLCLRTFNKSHSSDGLITEY